MKWSPFRRWISRSKFHVHDRCTFTLCCKFVSAFVHGEKDQQVVSKKGFSFCALLCAPLAPHLLYHFYFTLFVKPKYLVGATAVALSISQFIRAPNRISTRSPNPYSIRPINPHVARAISTHTQQLFRKPYRTLVFFLFMYLSFRDTFSVRSCIKLKVAFEWWRVFHSFLVKRKVDREEPNSRTLFHATWFILVSQLLHLLKKFYNLNLGSTEWITSLLQFLSILRYRANNRIADNSRMAFS